MKITIPGKPISVNAMYRGRRFLTDEGKSIKESNCWEIKRQWKGKPMQGPVEVIIELFFSTNQRRDIDGPIKNLLDCMTGIVYEDDSQIMKISVIRKKAKEPRVDMWAFSIA